MKKLILGLGAILFGFLSGNAQITIEVADFPQVGDFIFQGRDTLVAQGITEGSAGANQTFDLSGLQTWTFDTLEFEDPTNVTGNDSFPSAFLAVSQFGGFGFVEDNSGTIEIIGFSGEFMGLGAQMTVPFIDPQTVIDIPANYQDSFVDTSLIDVWLSNNPPIFPSPIPGVTIDSIRFKRVTHIDSEIDGYGSVTGPTGTFDCLRQFNYETSIDSIWIKTSLSGWILAPDFGEQFTNPNLDTNLRYNFITKELGYIFATINKNNQGEIEFATFESHPDSCCAGVGEYTFAESSNIEVYPNPARNEITVEAEDFNLAYFELFDMTGKQVFNQAVHRVEKIDLTGIEKGIYLFRVISEEGQLLRAGKLGISQ